MGSCCANGETIRNCSFATGRTEPLSWQKIQVINNYNITNGYHIFDFHTQKEPSINEKPEKPEMSENQENLEKTAQVESIPKESIQVVRAKPENTGCPNPIFMHNTIISGSKCPTIKEISETSIVKDTTLEEKKQEKVLTLSIRLSNSNIENEKITMTSNSINGNPPRNPFKFYFGSKSDLNNDYSFDDDKIRDQKFYIKFEQNTFYLYRNSETYFLSKINKPLRIRDHEIINIFSNISLIVEILLNNRISITLVHQDRKFNYEFDKTTPLIRVGKSSKADISYDHEGISKIHCCFKYDRTKWVLYDGQGLPGSASRNGIYRLLVDNKPIELEKDMELVIGNVKMKVDMIIPELRSSEELRN